MVCTFSNESRVYTSKIRKVMELKCIYWVRYVNGAA